jgi:hypothetical protein
VSSFTPGSGRHSDAAAQDRHNAATEGEYGHVYGMMVSFLLANGWRREAGGSGWWWRAGFDEATLGRAVEQQLEKDGIDFRRRLIGEPDEFWNFGEQDV